MSNYLIFILFHTQIIYYKELCMMYNETQDKGKLNMTPLSYASLQLLQIQIYCFICCLSKQY